ncbi:MAG: hypothetical protein LBN37_04535 [Bacteroidales bacterium]|jgi:hypothetical protein|nr:hypothetical protein [Bacteroidales bacterium]
MSAIELDNIKTELATKILTETDENVVNELVMFFRSPRKISVRSEVYRKPYSRAKDTVVRKILSFKALNNNWDGYGAVPSEVESSFNAIKLLSGMKDKYVEKLTEIYPNPQGTINLEWSDDSGKMLSVEIGNSSMSYYCVAADSGLPVFENNVPFETSHIQKLEMLIDAM